MPGLLTRSKSLRLLRGSRKDVRQEETPHPLPLPNNSKAEIDMHKLAVPISTPLRKPEIPNMTTRPRTANGPGDRPPLFHKKTNPVPSLYSQDHIQSLPALSSSTVVLSSAEGRGGLDDHTGVIGIALGSPTRGSHWNIATPQTPEYNTESSDENTDTGNRRAVITSSDNARQNPPKSKLSRWKSLFKRTARPPTQQDKQSFYQVVSTVATDRADSHHTNESLDTQIPEEPNKEINALSPPAYKPDSRKSRSAEDEPAAFPQPPQPRQRAWTVEVNPTEHRRTRIKRASTAPSIHTNGLALKPLQVAQTETVKAPLRSLFKRSPTVPQVEVMSSPQIMTVGTPQEIPLLDISIPDEKLERYSVMFGTVLQQPPSQNVSLLERRQANAEKIRPPSGLSIKGLEEGNLLDHPPKRRATSPMLPSPQLKLSLFPPTNAGRPPSPRPASRNRNRSRTTPANSPLSQTLSPTSGEGNSTPSIPKPEPTATMKVKPRRPALTSGSVRGYDSDSELITVIVDNTAGGDSQGWNISREDKQSKQENLPRLLTITKRDVDVQIAEPMEAPKSEPTPVSTPRSLHDEEPSVIQTLTRLASQRQPRVTKLSALSSHPSSAPLDIPSPLENLEALLSPPLTPDEIHDQPQDRATLGIARSVSVSRKAENKATVGIARSVSVSRAKSPRPSLRTGATSDVGSPQRFVERRTLTPTIVEVGNRRSQRVMLVDA
ncbi:hypothetical protein P153DRAFT_373149 [Dothidotthia symphoricarpi CBS 119687]|uniref:Uncharacterized protein n=1 Tax=Dothidotthia symphoricarpi CBS 119687 TaxID=1392245 RepID=A0A6A6AQW8_9PLEO|nr:uncharacterized protein P153DRAFT_373149 [Dothidotthia symphoricarpi CBS 119687]KAF2133568.1 hypothetical protein P153DRAFT_373149 [Dothidotthia symphoricarpi CBS 119687]